MITAEKQFTTGENFYSQHLLGAHRMKAGYVFVSGRQMRKMSG